ncbi:hypothetical protein [Mycobacterium pseudokansasii]|uniref:hypothetical protein n=1 Tax=Mycobacterium pseudokansasii TaxID=2341080 RepID=UPI000F2B5A03|nr:hypothetical protein [Mycobacterium pseudokansasii]VAZ98568.1 hypothetical protein LAUMK35_04048 [Mycobacterium pseudokansasii]VAZ99986.1 hypothetical protein LAUMK21_04044 [Mycobacterium pseudokansasii]
MSLDTRTEEWLARLLADPPPLSQAQQDLIASAFAGALIPPRSRHGRANREGAAHDRRAPA